MVLLIVDPSPRYHRQSLPFKQEMLLATDGRCCAPSRSDPPCCPCAYRFPNASTDRASHLINVSEKSTSKNSAILFSNYINNSKFVLFLLSSLSVCIRVYVYTQRVTYMQANMYEARTNRREKKPNKNKTVPQGKLAPQQTFLLFSTTKRHETDKSIKFRKIPPLFLFISFSVINSLCANLLI